MIDPIHSMINFITKKPTVSDILCSPDKWSKGHLAKDKNGNHTYPEDKKAYSFCLFGAMIKAYGLKDITLPKLRVEKILLNRELHGKITTIARFNDDPTTTYEMVMELVKETGI